MVHIHTFAGGWLDRAGDKRRDDAWLADRRDSLGARFVALSKLRALIGSLQPVETLDGPGGEIEVRLRLDRYEVVWLVAGTTYAMREEERL